MFRNYIKIAWRHFIKNRVFSFINIFGLSIGLTCCILISLYIFHESAYDAHHKQVKHLYQLATIFVKDGKEEKMPNTPAPMAAAMKNDFPEIVETARLMSLFAEDKTLLQWRGDNGESKSFYESKGYMADATFFKLFDYDFIEGNPATCLEAANMIVLSEEIARKMFGNSHALNKRIQVSSNTNGDSTFTVGGVFRPANSPSHIDARFFISVRGGGIEGFINSQTDMAGNNMFSTYFLLKDEADATKLEAKFPAFVDKYIGKSLKAMGFYKKQFLIPVKDIHLYAGIKNNVTATGNRAYLYILGSIASFTLLIACINFMNLSTARASRRSGEVGIRKVLGAQKHSLVRQFIGESMLMSLAALLIALVAAKLLLPSFSYISGRNLSFSLSQHKFQIAGFIALSIITGLLAGSYPAFYLSSFRPILVLKGKLRNTFSATLLRKGLVVFQFVISSALIIASVVIANQMKYMRTKDLGFAKDQQIILPMRTGNAKNVYTPLRNEIKASGLASEVGATLYYPGIVNPSDLGLYMEGKSVNESKLVHTNWIDENFLQTLEIKPTAGRLFSKDFPADTSGSVILNEAAIKEIGFPSAAASIGKRVMFDWRGQTTAFTIVGVVKDFHFRDLHVPIEPYGFYLNNRPFYNYLVVHAKAADLSRVLPSIEKSWNKLNPNEPFEYSFLDEDFQKNYDAENRLASLVGYFTVIAVLISCLGLFGLAAFSAEQRTKEIGIRKVLGANVSGIVSLLSKDFLKLVVLSILIASPVAWWVMHKWLEDFAYRVSIGWWILLVAAVVSLLIAFITVSFQAIRAAMANPVRSLRTE